MKLAYNTKIIKSSEKLTDSYYKYIVNAASEVSLTLPDTLNIPDGFTIEVDNFTGKKINFVSNDKLNINFANKTSNILHATFTVGEWFIM
ncbi:hypothetical protein B6J67_28345 [Klebsiella quasipneumoniae]|nr:hypothetical protein B6J67_28345 [Klebsiella quasipneumoniae]PLJ64239.1 hypothetical protein B6J68_08555 [Klebsiella quasipneumoniae]